MTSERDLERAVRDWVAQGSKHLPDPALDTALQEISITPQRRAGWLARRFRMMDSNALRFAGAAAAVIAAAVVGLSVTDNDGSLWTRVGADPSAGPTAPPTPSPAPGAALEADVTELLNGFLEARVTGEGAQQYLNVPEEEVPLLYAATSGAPYERGEFEPVGGIEWPYGFQAFRVRMFAGDTVVEQLFFTPHDEPEHFPADGRLRLEYDPHGYATHIPPTTEDGQPVPVPYNAFDGEVALNVAHPWVFHDYSPGPTFGRLIPEGPAVMPTTDGGERNDWDELFLMADPAWAGTGCRADPASADAEALAATIRSDPGLEATDPVAVSVGGAEALMMDVKIEAGATVCATADPLGNIDLGVMSLVFDQSAGSEVDFHNGVATGRATGEWMRLYLFDVPEGLSMRVLAIAIVAPESRFERSVEAAVPVVNSVEFHAP